MKHYDAIFIVGPQGSGKGTQMKALAGRLGFYSWDTGKVLRENRGVKTVTGQTVGEIIDTGGLLTDAQLLGVVKPLIAAIPLEKGVIFDGIPRRIGQAEFITEFLSAQGRSSMATVFLDVPHDVSVKRLMLRAATEGRKDDTREAIEYRLKQYEDATVPMLEFLKQHTDYFPVDGRPPIPEVTQEIFQALGMDA